VYRGTYQGHDVAIKRLRDTSIDQNEINEFKMEAETMRKIPPHKNVVLFYGLAVNPLSLVT
jgi:hypothetical protein